MRRENARSWIWHERAQRRQCEQSEQSLELLGWLSLGQSLCSFLVSGFDLIGP